MKHFKDHKTPANHQHVFLKENQTLQNSELNDDARGLGINTKTFSSELELQVCINSKTG